MPNNITAERLTKFWEIKTRNMEEMLRYNLIKKLTCLNRCLHWVTQNPRKKVEHPGSVFLAELASLSDDYIETCDIHRKKLSCKCYVLPELHKITSVPPRLSDANNAKPRPQTHKKKSPPRPHIFNHEVGVDVFEIVDSIGMCFSILNAVRMGTTYDQAWIVRESESLGSSSSRACLRAFAHGWTRWAGWPKPLRCDRRTHNRGVFGSTLAKNGLAISPAGLEAPEQIGRVERRGAMLKKMMS